MTKHKIFGAFLWILALILLMTLCGTPIQIFINIPSALFVLLGIFGAMMLTRSPQQNRNERFEVIAQAAWHSGIISFVVGLISMLTYLEDTKAIGPNLAVALTGVFYGSVISLIFNTLSHKSQELEVSEKN